MLISRTGDTFTTVAVSWLVLRLAGPAQLGIVLLCFGLPRLVTAPWAGRLLDRGRARPLLVVDNAVRAALIGLVPALSAAHSLKIWMLYPIAILCAASSSFTEVAESALVPRLVDDGDLEPANTLLALNWEASYVVGPALAGLIVASLGVGFALGIDAASFVVMAIIMLRLPELAPLETEVGRVDMASAPPPRFRRLPALGVLLEYPAVLLLTAASVLVLFLGGVTEVLLPVLSRQALHVSAAGYGFLVASTGVGGMLGTGAGGAFVQRFAPRMRLVLILSTGGLLLAPLVLAHTMALAVAAVAASAFCLGPYFATERSLMQRLTPAHLRGRVSGARGALSSLGFPVGGLVGGFLLSHVGVRAVVLAIGGSYIVLGLWLMFAFLRGRRAFDVSVDVSVPKEHASPVAWEPNVLSAQAEP